jgi:putative peptidoglycan lipid II flippase
VPLFDSAGILPIFAMGVGAIAGGVLQFAVQWPIMRREGFQFQFRLDWTHPGIQRIRRLLGPAVIGVSAVQINVLVNTQLASFLQDNGPVSWLSYAFRIMYLPIGLFGVAVGVVNLREVSVFVAQERFQELKETVANSVKLVSFLAIPSTFGLILLAGPIVRILFQRGDFTASDTHFTAWALVAYSVGLFAYSCNKVYVPTFYALDDTKTPVRISLLAVGINLVVNLIFIATFPADYRFVGLALGTAVSVSVSNSLLSYRLRRRLGGFQEFGVMASVGRCLLAAVVMGAAVWFVLPRVQQLFGTERLLSQAAALGSVIVLGLALYIGGCRILRVNEVDYLARIWRRVAR